MRKYFFIAAAACIIAASCQKNELSALIEENKATLVISLSSEQARASAAATSAESSVDASKVYLFVFKADGSREYGQAVTLTDKSVSVDLTAGAKIVWVVVNCPGTILDAATYAEFKTKVSDLSDNASGFVMAGSATKTIIGDDSVSVTLRRLVSKVCLVNFTRNFSDTDYAASTLTLNRVYLSNVCGECRYFSDGGTATAIEPASVSAWYNRLGVWFLTAADLVSLLSVTIGQDIADGSSYTTEQALYAYPNACTTPDNHGSIWNMATNPRHTRLVLDCTLAGTRGYYSVTLPVMESNKVYNVSLTVRKRPSDNPEDNGTEIIPNLAFAVSISVADWDTPVHITETL